MKLFSKENLSTTQKSIRSKSKWLKRRSMILALFALSINVYAWFVFSTKANLSVDANVMNWNLDFLDSNAEVQEAVIFVGEMYPGMPTYTKQYVVKNASDVEANFTYTIDEVNVLGFNSINEGETNNEIINSLETSYPFIISIGSDKTVLGKNDQLTFTIEVEWPYESVGTDFYKLTKHYTFDPSLIYYSFDGTNYIEDTSVTALNFTDKITEGRYLEKDDADSFWGATCKGYQLENDTSCINVHIKMLATQTG